MKIGDNDFKKAVEIITTYVSSVTVSLNVPIRDNYSNVYPILLHDAAPGLIHKLVNAGFSVGICDKGAYVNKI